jgi:hypothetical protein
MDSDSWSVASRVHPSQLQHRGSSLADRYEVAAPWAWSTTLAS